MKRLILSVVILLVLTIPAFSDVGESVSLNNLISNSEQSDCKKVIIYGYLNLPSNSQ